MSDDRLAILKRKLAASEAFPGRTLGGYEKRVAKLKDEIAKLEAQDGGQ